MEYAPSPVKKLNTPPRDVALKGFKILKKSNQHVRNRDTLIRKKGPDPTKVTMPPMMRLGGSMTTKRSARKTMPKSPAEFLPRNSGFAPTTREKGIRLASL